MIGVLVACSLGLLAPAQEEREYVAYGRHDVEACFELLRTPEGSSLRTNLEKLDRILSDLLAHAGGYPPIFETKDERERAERDVERLDSLLGIVVDGEEPDGAMLLRHARVNAIGHNLDLEGAAQRADDSFTRLLEREPEHALGHYYFGCFLASTGNGGALSVPHFERAIELGITTARFELGLAHLMLGDEQKALEHLRAFSKEHPADERALEIIEAIEGGRIQRNQE